MAASKPLHIIDDKNCRADGICVEVCPRDVLELHGDSVRTVAGTEEHCLRCGQCVAVCPNDALELDSHPGDRYEPVEKWGFTYDEFMAFLNARRSHRVFKDKPVDRETIDKVLEACAAAPPPFPPHEIEVLVLDHPDDRKKLVESLVAGYDKLLGYFGNPIKRFVIRQKRGAEMYHALESHVLDVIRYDNARFRDKGVDRYLYEAPVLLLFHCNRWVASHQEAGLVVATYGMLAAHAAGLGATMLSIVPPLLNNLDHELRRSYGIPDDNHVIVSLAMGYPKYKYSKTVRRPLRNTRYLRP